MSYLCSAPYTLLPLRGISPQGETRDMREKTASRILHVPFWRFPPLVADATTFPPLKRWDYGCLAMELRGAVMIAHKKAVKMVVLKFHSWNELLKSSIQKKDKIPVTAMKIICKKIFANSPALCYNSPAGMARLF